MSDKEKKLHLSDLIDINFLQEFQDAFAKTTNMACLVYDDDGPITKPTNFTIFCEKYTKGTNMGFERCSECHLNWGQVAVKNREPIIYTCHTGLTSFIVPIYIADKHIASICGGQVLTDTPCEEDFKKIAKELGINEKVYLHALKKIKIIPMENIKAASQLLFMLTNTISKIIYQNNELIIKNERENLTNKIIEALRSTLNAEEIKKYFVDITANYFNADRCLFVDYDKTKGIFLPFRIEKLKSNKIQSYIDIDTEEKFPEFCAKLKQGKNIIIKNLKKTLSKKKFLGYKAVQALQKSEVKSDYGLLIKYREDIIGILIIHFITKARALTHDEFDFMKILGKHAGTALYQAELYATSKKIAQREVVNRSIIEILRSTLDKKIIKKLFVKNIGKFFNADRVYFSEYAPSENIYLPIDEHSEYLSGPEEKSFVAFDWSDPAVKEFIEPLLSKRELNIHNWQEYVNTHDMKPELVNLFNEANIKSSYNFPVIYEGRIMGYFCIDFTRKIWELLDDDINRIRSICTQAGIALHHAELYIQAQEAIRTKSEIIIEVSTGIKEPVNSILKDSKILSELELERDKQLEYLNNIIGSCEQLFKLTKDILDKFEI